MEFSPDEPLDNVSHSKNVSPNQIHSKDFLRNAPRENSAESLVFCPCPAEKSLVLALEIRVVEYLPSFDVKPENRK